MASRNIKFQYYRIMECRGDRQSPYDLQKVILQIIKLPLCDRICEVSGEKARLEDIKKLDKINPNFLAMRFMKLSEYALHVSKENEPSEDIRLDDDEYIGQDVNVVYDTSIYVLLIQKNRGSISIHSIEKYLNHFYVSENNTYLKLEPLVNSVDIRQLKGAFYKKIDIKFANIINCKPEDSKNFNEVIAFFNRFTGYNASISISLGRSKIKTLERDAVNNAISEAKDVQSLFSDFKVKYTDDEDISQVYDLFDNIIYEIITYSIKPRVTLGFEYATINMAENFSERLPVIYKAIGMR